MLIHVNGGPGPSAYQHPPTAHAPIKQSLVVPLGSQSVLRCCERVIPPHPRQQTGRAANCCVAGRGTIVALRMSAMVA